MNFRKKSIINHNDGISLKDSLIMALIVIRMNTIKKVFLYLLLIYRLSISAPSYHGFMNTSKKHYQTNLNKFEDFILNIRHVSPFSTFDEAIIC